MTRLRRTFGLAAATLCLAAPASAATFRATLHAPNHDPRAGDRHWFVTVTARTPTGRPLRASAYYQFLFRGRVVSTQYPNPKSRPGTRHSPWNFRGRYRDSILWPKRAIGIPLTFRVVVKVKRRGVRKLSWAIKVRS